MYIQPKWVPAASTLCNAAETWPHMTRCPTACSSPFIILQPVWHPHFNQMNMVVQLLICETTVWSLHWRSTLTHLPVLLLTFSSLAIVGMDNCMLVMYSIQFLEISSCNSVKNLCISGNLSSFMICKLRSLIKSDKAKTPSCGSLNVFAKDWTFHGSKQIVNNQNLKADVAELPETICAVAPSTVSQAKEPGNNKILHINNVRISSCAHIWQIRWYY